ncbi:hypothetical protein FKW77_010090 [Venturia effusa]|uniref:Uncharacterized protein n=1 Tax=Venturia effusa TaxID=50376 RepID=A0A517L6A0_9PEZI|nr:hypothetical protein FKW77_010090 [Venturia effusa]
MTRSDGLTNTICSNNWGESPFQIAKRFGHHCTHHKCENGAGNLERCYGSDHHMMLCDICGAGCRTSHGCDQCEKSPERINMVAMAKWNDRIDPQEDWRTYVEAVKREEEYAKIYPALVYNASSWQADLHAHILARRRRKFDGTESEERKKAQKAAKMNRDQYSAQLRERQTTGGRSKQRKGSWNDTRSILRPGSKIPRRRPLPTAEPPIETLDNWLLGFLSLAPPPTSAAPVIPNAPAQ